MVALHLPVAQVHPGKVEEHAEITKVVFKELFIIEKLARKLENMGDERRWIIKSRKSRNVDSSQRE